MRSVKRAGFLLVFLLLISGSGYFLVANYSVVFSKRVRGEVVGLERVTQPIAVMSGSSQPEQMFSFAVSVKNESGEIFTSSSEDRQWAVVPKGACVDARFDPYPPWNLQKGGTFHNARLKKIFECEKK